MAARLSEVAGWRVLLLEAGGTPPPESHVPAFNGALYRGEADWNFITTPQRYSSGSFIDNVRMERCRELVGTNLRSCIDKSRELVEMNLWNFNNNRIERGALSWKFCRNVRIERDVCDEFKKLYR